MDQIAIALTGAVAVFLSQDKRESWRRWACIFGICGQPFWIYATLHSEQYGMFVLTLLYTVAWVRGVWNNWIVNAK